MNRLRKRIVLAAACAAALGATLVGSAQRTGGAPTIVVETSKGAFSFVTFPEEAPATVAHVVRLVRAGFYDGLRVHRALPGFVVQFGDPQTRDSSKRELWGRGAAAGSGEPVGVAELSPKRIHRKGAVALAHMGDPSKADSQMYLALADRSDLDGKYAVFGQLAPPSEVPERLQIGDVILRMYVQP
jgi:cyclophilin family peptidyl-prolyl cis-trans isomerase